LLFPEGTRNGIEKNGKLQNGAVVMSLTSGAEIIPIGINATYRPFSKIKINIGKPMDLSEFRKLKNDKEVVTSLSNKLMKEIIRLTNME